ncbi:MAG: hypothetical protein ACD_4C00377G0002 [uncultured bacterium (gcode 4)]|uniref:Uncharacterized protein n=1 Tax=uncultured bacterium (gcode 4) TaxID=1234023 RepID=K2FTK0_9BACT|nr:MAG: hypothetical protein ACD_4C00377G0002 [uncultured bacterium (gcode 4)]
MDKKIIKLNIPLLYKLNKWILVENKEEIYKIKKELSNWIELFILSGMKSDREVEDLRLKKLKIKF